MTKHYTKDKLTVIWQPHLCQHSTKCFQGLQVVFDPGKSPWIDMNGADAEHIIQQVKACPSGALTYRVEEEPA